MAEIMELDGLEEFYAHFIRVDGERGTILIFADDKPIGRMQLAKELGEVLDSDSGRWPCGCVKGETPHGAGWRDCKESQRG